jgi:hypothetical protein
MLLLAFLLLIVAYYVAVLRLLSHMLCNWSTSRVCWPKVISHIWLVEPPTSKNPRPFHKPSGIQTWQEITYKLRF